MIEVGVRHRRILSHHIHASNLAIERSIHNLNDREARLFIKIHLPVLFKPRPDTLVVHPLVVRKHHGYQASVRRALHIVLTPQRMQTRSRSAYIASHQGQRDQCPRIVGAMDVLGYTHTPENHRIARCSIQTSHFADLYGINTTKWRHGFGAITGNVFLNFFKIFRVLIDVITVDEIFFNDGIDHCIQQSHIRIWPELKKMMGMAGKICTAGINDDKRGIRPCGIFHESGRHGMIARRICSNHNDNFGICNICNLI